MGLAWPVNLGALGNSLAIWLGISPWQLFFYGFLPPLLLDAAVRIDWYMFRKVRARRRQRRARRQPVTAAACSAAAAAGHGGILPG